MNKHKPQGKHVNHKYSRYLSKHGMNDIWARELLNGLFEIDDMDGKGNRLLRFNEFTDNYQLFEEINNG